MYAKQQPERPIYCKYYEWSWLAWSPHPSSEASRSRAELASSEGSRYALSFAWLTAGAQEAASARLARQTGAFDLCGCPPLSSPLNYILWWPKTVPRKDPGLGVLDLDI